MRHAPGRSASKSYFRFCLPILRRSLSAGKANTTERCAVRRTRPQTLGRNMAKVKDLNALASRVEQVRAECEAYIDLRTAELKRELPTLPIDVLRMEVVAGFRDCPCKTVLNLMLKENKERKNV